LRPASATTKIRQIVGDEVASIQGLATETADHLAEALARCVPIIGSNSDLPKQVYDFILTLSLLGINLALSKFRLVASGNHPSK
jgi:hypothetical protein